MSRVLAFSLTAVSLALGAGLVRAVDLDDDAVATTMETLGERLFFDVNLSANRTQACASCHQPDFAFSDAGAMGSLGDDGVSIGDRNAPPVTYAAMIPPFHQNEAGEWVGGQFWDGRASRLEDQAGGPPLSPGEMGMKSAAHVVARLSEDPVYVSAFAELFPGDVLADADAGYAAMTEAIAAFERTAIFMPFDSRYDRFLRGEIELTRQEELGRVLFFSQQFTNCNICHQLQASAVHPQETFSDYRFHNVGTPENLDLRAMNGVPVGTKDLGLAAN
ncbi:MAG: cytochrome c peroxidase, partial [Pseudomonadota bacterium]